MSLLAKLPDNLTTPEGAAALLGATKAIASELEGNTAALKRLEADFVTASQRAEEQRAASRMVEKPMTGREGDLLHTLDAAKGHVRALSQTSTIVWAGKSYEVTNPGLLDAAPVNEWHADLQRAVAARNVFRKMKGTNHSPKLDAEVVGLLARAPQTNGFRAAIEKAWSDTSGAGGEWVPDTFVPSLYEEFFLPNMVAALFPVISVSGPIIVPSLTDTHRPYIKGKVTVDNPSAYTASTATTGSTTIEPAAFAVRTLVDDALVEDSAIALLPTLMRSMGRAIGDAYEDCMMNGDTNATHQDAIASWNIRSRWGASNLGGSADHRRAFLGFRALAADRTATVDLSATQTAAGVMGSVVGAMGERAASDIVLLTSPEVMFQKLAVDSNVLTVDKLGAAATILTGQVASIGGHPVIMTRWMGADLATTGLFTATGAYSGLVAVDRGAWQHYQRRGPVIEMEREMTLGAYNLVGTLRRTFRTLSASTEKVSYYAYKML